MVRMKRTKRVLRGRRLWLCLDTLMDYKRDPNHSINEHVNHVVNMIKCLKVEYIFQSNYKKRILQMSLTKPEDSFKKYVGIRSRRASWFNK